MRNISIKQGIKRCVTKRDGKIQSTFNRNETIKAVLSLQARLKFIPINILVVHKLFCRVFCSMYFFFQIVEVNEETCFLQKLEKKVFLIETFIFTDTYGPKIII